MDYSDYSSSIMIRYSSYSEPVLLNFSVMNLKIDEIVGGKYIDFSGNGYDADVVTINAANDGIQLANNTSLKTAMEKAGLYPLFYDGNGSPVPVLMSHIGKVYNNIFFRNDTYMLLCVDFMRGSALTGTMLSFFGEMDTDALTIIYAVGVTSVLQQRIIDIVVKDIKALNITQPNLFVVGNPTTSHIKVFYGMVGDTFDQLKYNWINPTDSDSANRLSLLSGVDVPMLPNLIDFDGSGCYTTFFNASTYLGNDNHFAFDSPFNLADGDKGKNVTATINDSYELGCLSTIGSYKGICLAIRRDDGSHSICEDTYQSPTKGVQSAEIVSRGLYLTNKVASDNLKQYKENTQIGSTVTNAGTSVYADGNVVLGGCSVDGVIDSNKLSTMPCSLFSIGDAIDASVLTSLQDALIRFRSSKVDYYFPPDETSLV